jgi:hypothetical protein
LRATIPIAIPPGTKLLHMYYDVDAHTWNMWLHHDLQMQHGTQLVLEPGGGIERVTVKPDGTEQRFRVR